MATTAEVQRDSGHPWDGRPGFDLLHLNADSQVEMEALVKEAERKFWRAWLVGIDESTGRPGGVMYKPCDTKAPWEDSPKKPHPGNIREPQRVS